MLLTPKKIPVLSIEGLQPALDGGGGGGDIPLVVGTKRKVVESNDGKSQCHVCNKWYCRLNRHLEQVHKLVHKL